MLTFSEYINEGIVGNIAKKVIVGTIVNKAAKKVKEIIKGDASERFVKALEGVNATLIHGFRDNNKGYVYFVKCKHPEIGELVAQVSKAIRKENPSANPFEKANFTFYGTIKTKNGETLKPGTLAYFSAMIHHPKDKFDVEEIAHYKDK